MAISADGIIEANYDPETATVRLGIDGGMWPQPYTIRENLAPNPRPHVDTRGWEVAPGETRSMRIVTDRDGDMAVELRESSGGVGVYVDTASRPTPEAGQWVGIGYDVRALDIETAQNMRLRISGYDGDVVDGGTLEADLAEPRVNMFPNPSFETGTAGLLANSNVTLGTTRNTASVRAGGHALTATVSSTAGTFTYVGQVIQGCAPGAWYGVRTPVRWVSGSRWFRLRVLFRDANGAALAGGDTYSAWVYGETAYADLTVAGQAPAGAVRADAYLYVHSTNTGSAPAASVFHTDAWMAISGPSEAAVLAAVEQYVDGDVDDTVDYEHVWDGTPHASVSRALRPYERLTLAAQVTEVADGGYVRALVFPWPNPVAPVSGFRARNVVLVVANTEQDALDAVATPLDGDMPPDPPVQRYWSGVSYESSTVEAWSAQTPTSVTVLRTVPGEAPIPVRDFEDVYAPGGYAFGSDIEMPLDVPVTYTVQGTDDYGNRSTDSSVTLTTTGGRWGLWIKVPGRGDLTLCARFAGVEDATTETRGGNYMIPRDDVTDPARAIAQSSGADPESITVRVSALDAQEVARLKSVLQHRVLLLQQGEPEEFDSGYYLVQSVRRVNPAQKRVDIVPLRHFDITMQRTSRPAGTGIASGGTTYAALSAMTYQQIADQFEAYVDLMTVAPGTV